MHLYHTPSPNPQKITFAMLELGLDCEIIPVDFTKGEHRTSEFLALNPFGKVPVLVDDDLVMWDSHAILAYLGDKTRKLWPTSTAGRADALRWLFFLAGHLYPPAFDLGFNRVRERLRGIPGDQDAIARGEQNLPGVVGIVEGQLRNNQWLLGNDFTLVDCAYCPILNLIEKADFGFSDFPKVQAYLDACRSRPAWKDTPKLPGL